MVEEEEVEEFKQKSVPVARRAAFGYGRGGNGCGDGTSGGDGGGGGGGGGGEGGGEDNSD